MAKIWPLKKIQTARPEPVRLTRQKLPRHVAMVIEPSEFDAEAFSIESLKGMIELQLKLGIQRFTFNFISTGKEGYIEGLIPLFEALLSWETVDERQIKILVLGRWYDLPTAVTDKIKALTGKTRDYTGPAVYIGVNYDGQEEIVDAVSRIARQVRAQKVDPERITKESIKTNLDTSMIPAPDLIITTGKGFSLRSFMLWDAAYSKIYFSNKPWAEFGKGQLLKALLFNQSTQ